MKEVGLLYRVELIKTIFLVFTCNHRLSFCFPVFLIELLKQIN